MKRFISIIITLVMLLTLVGCGGVSNTSSSSSSTPVENSENEKSDSVETAENESELKEETPDSETPVALNVGESFSTDIIELTVKDAKLSYYAKTPSTSTSSGKTSNPDEACMPGQAGDSFAAKKGRTLVCLDFVIKNLDRGKLDTMDYPVLFGVVQGEVGAQVNGYDLNNSDGRPGMTYYLSITSINGSDYNTNLSANIIIDPGDTIEIKVVGIAPADFDIDAPFNLYGLVKNSSGEMEQATYYIEN